MSRTIELPDELYESLERVARDQGVSPADWIAHAIPADDGAAGSVAERLEGLAGAVNGSKRPGGDRSRSPFSDLLANKFEKQGLRRT